MDSALEQGTALFLDFSKSEKVGLCTGVLPVVVQHADTGEVLILAYLNLEAFQMGIKRGIAIFWSTSRQTLWIKGETSGDYLDLLEVRVNCEQNALLYRVRPRKGGVCHVRDGMGDTRTSCFYRKVVVSEGRVQGLQFL